MKNIHFQSKRSDKEALKVSVLAELKCRTARRKEASRKKEKIGY